MVATSILQKIGIDRAIENGFFASIFSRSLSADGLPRAAL